MTDQRPQMIVQVPTATAKAAAIAPAVVVVARPPTAVAAATTGEVTRDAD